MTNDLRDLFAFRLGSGRHLAIVGGTGRPPSDRSDRRSNPTTYDQMMLDERPGDVLLAAEHLWTNPPGSEHLEPPDSRQTWDDPR